MGKACLVKDFGRLLNITQSTQVKPLAFYKTLSTMMPFSW